MGVLFGLLAALLWGTADSSAALASRRTGSFAVVVGFHVLSAVGLVVAAVATGAIDDLGAGEAFPLVWVGALGALSYATFYKSLEIGPISIASPIISAYAAVSVILALVVLGESLSSGQVAAVVVVMAGVLLASADLAQFRAIERRQVLGIVLALVTALAIGGFVFGNAYYARDRGWLMPIVLSRGFSTLLLLAVALKLAPWRGGGRRSPRWLGLVALVALADTGGYVAFNLGAERAETSVLSAAAAPYAILPILLGVLLLGERPRPIQWLGVAAVIGGVVLLGLAS